MDGYRLLIASGEPHFCPPGDYDDSVFDPLHVMLGSDHPHGANRGGGCTFSNLFLL